MATNTLKHDTTGLERVETQLKLSLVLFTQLSHKLVHMSNNTDQSCA